MENFLKYFLSAYYTLFFLLAMFLPTYRIWKATGVNPYKLGSSDSAHDYIGRLFRVTLIACAFVIMAFVFFPSIYVQLLPIPFFAHAALRILGLSLLLAALVWVLVAQRGLFRISRNPIFLGMRLMLVGLFLTLPNAAMLTILVSGEILMQIQVRLEEDFLTRAHGDKYLSYRNQVRRWI